MAWTSHVSLELSRWPGPLTFATSDIIQCDPLALDADVQQAAVFTKTPLPGAELRQSKASSLRCPSHSLLTLSCSLWQLRTEDAFRMSSCFPAVATEQGNKLCARLHLLRQQMSEVLKAKCAEQFSGMEEVSCNVGMMTNKKAVRQL